MNIKKINLNHSFIFFLFCNIFSLILFKFSNFILSPLFCLFLILIIGVSHGSLDHVKGGKLLKIFKIENISLFYISYILLAVMVVTLWIFIENNKLIDLGIILSSNSSIILFIKKFNLKNFSIFFDYFSILILNYYLSPLVAFTAYFCFLHSVRHSITLIYELDNNNIKNGLLIFIQKAMPLTILTAIICLVGIYLLNFKYDFDNSIIKVIFIGLASLTFPHILLEYLLDKNEKQRT